MDTYDWNTIKNAGKSRLNIIKSDDELTWGVVITLGILFCVCVIIFGIALIHGIDKELARQEIVRDYHCAQYGEEMQQWAIQRGMPSPCQ